MNKVKLVFFAWLVSGTFTAYAMAGFPIPGCEFEADNRLGYVAECPLELVDPRLNIINYPDSDIEEVPSIALVMMVPTVVVIFWLLSSTLSWFIYPIIAAMLFWPEFKGRVFNVVRWGHSVSGVGQKQ